MIAWSIPSWNTSNTSHWMTIVQVKRVCIKIPSIGECRYKTMLGSVMLVMNIIDHVPVLTNIWNFKANSFAPYNTHLMWCVLCMAWWYCLWNPKKWMLYGWNLYIPPLLPYTEWILDFPSFRLFNIGSEYKGSGYRLLLIILYATEPIVNAYRFVVCWIG